MNHSDANDDDDGGYSTINHGDIDDDVPQLSPPSPSIIQRELMGSRPRPFLASSELRVSRTHASNSSSSRSSSRGSRRRRRSLSVSSNGSNKRSHTDNSSGDDNGEAEEAVAESKRPKPKSKTKPKLINRFNPILGALSINKQPPPPSTTPTLPPSSSAQQQQQQQHISESKAPLVGEDGGDDDDDNNGAESDQESRSREAQMYEERRRRREVARFIENARVNYEHEMMREAVLRMQQQQQQQQRSADGGSSSSSSNGDGNDEEKDPNDHRNFVPSPILAPIDIDDLEPDHRRREIEGAKSAPKGWCFLCRYSQHSNVQRISEHGSMDSLYYYIRTNQPTTCRPELCKGIQWRYEKYLRPFIKDENDRHYWTLESIFAHITEHDRSFHNQTECDYEIINKLTFECSKGAIQYNPETGRKVVVKEHAKNLESLITLKLKLGKQLEPLRDAVLSTAASSSSSSSSFSSSHR